MTDPTYADYLRTDGLRAACANPSATAWGGIAVDSTARCPFDSGAAANAEAARQIAFLAGPRVIETIRVIGQQASLVGRTVTIIADVAGYRGAGGAVFVIGATESDGDATTNLTVIRRL